jgi:hypothetical protein
VGRDIENDPFKSLTRRDVIIKSEQMSDNDFRLRVMPELVHQLAYPASVVEVDEHRQSLQLGPVHDSFEFGGSYPEAIPTLVELESTKVPFVVETLEVVETFEFVMIPVATQHDPVKGNYPVREFLLEPVDMFIARSNMTDSAGQSDDHPGQAIRPSHNVCVRKTTCDPSQRVRLFAFGLAGYQNNPVYSCCIKRPGDSLGAQEGATRVGVPVDDHVVNILASMDATYTLIACPNDGCQF